ncbi:MAG: hypothetical protein ACLQHF_01770 [Terracidiphilus sp.]
MPEVTKAAMARVSVGLRQSPINAHMLNLYASGLAKQFSASRKYRAGDAWFPDGSGWMQPLGEWVGLLPVNDRECEADDDAYFAAVLGYASSQLPQDIVRPLFVRFFQDQAMSPSDEKRGQHTINVLCSMVNKLPPLEGLFVDDLRLGNGAPLLAFTDIRVLSMARCRNIADFTFLRNLKSLEALRLDETEIADLSPLLELAQSKILSLIGCKQVTIKSLTPLVRARQSGRFSSLHKIYLQETGILGVSEAVLSSGDPDSIFRALSS